jgi:hypothetical protein
VQTFRDRIHLLYRRYRAILVLTNATTPDDRLAIESNVARIPAMPAAKLRARAKELAKEVARLEAHFGVIGSRDELERIFNEPVEREGTVHFISKFDMLRMFTHYERALPIFPQLPLHGRVTVDSAAVSGHRTLGFFLLEASLFEDMAALWNAARGATETAAHPDATFPQVKEATAFRRATAKAAFSVLEAYLNGIALDVLIMRTVTPEIEELLEEWSQERNRPRYLTLRDKILQYVKIACDIKNPPIQESNSPPMRILLEAERQVRNSLVHPTARLTRADPEGREGVFFHLPLEAVREICDATSALIRQISATIGPSFGDVSWWLFDRGNDDCYPEATFM